MVNNPKDYQKVLKNLLRAESIEIFKDWFYLSLNKVVPDKIQSIQRDCESKGMPNLKDFLLEGYGTAYNTELKQQMFKFITESFPEGTIEALAKILAIELSPHWVVTYNELYGDHKFFTLLNSQPVLPLVMLTKLQDTYGEEATQSEDQIRMMVRKTHGPFLPPKEEDGLSEPFIEMENLIRENFYKPIVGLPSKDYLIEDKQLKKYGVITKERLKKNNGNLTDINENQNVKVSELYKIHSYQVKWYKTSLCPYWSYLPKKLTGQIKISTCNKNEKSYKVINLMIYSLFEHLKVVQPLSPLLKNLKSSEIHQIIASLMNLRINLDLKSYGVSLINNDKCLFFSEEKRDSLYKTSLITKNLKSKVLRL